MIRIPRQRASLAAGLTLVACLACGCVATPSATAPASDSAPPVSTGSPGSSTAESAGTSPAPSSGGKDPCSLLSADVINQTLGTSVGDGTLKDDPARQIVTCTWQQDNLQALVNVGIAETPGEDAFKTNSDLAPAYFDATAKPVTVAGADKAYLVIEKDLKAPVIGMLIGDRFVLVQATAPAITTDQGMALATQVARNLQ